MYFKRLLESNMKYSNINSNVQDKENRYKYWLQAKLNLLWQFLSYKYRIIIYMIRHHHIFEKYVLEESTLDFYCYQYTNLKFWYIWLLSANFYREKSNNMQIMTNLLYWFCHFFTHQFSESLCLKLRIYFCLNTYVLTRFMHNNCSSRNLKRIGCAYYASF